MAKMKESILIFVFSIIFITIGILHQIDTDRYYKGNFVQFSVKECDCFGIDVPFSSFCIGNYDCSCYRSVKGNEIQINCSEYDILEKNETNSLIP